MSNDPWDGLPSGNYVKWENEGDTVVGDVVGKGRGVDLHDNPIPELYVRLDDGEEVTVSAGQAQLKAKLLEARPQVGDRIRIVYLRKESRGGGKTLKHFDVTVKTGGAKSPGPQPEPEAAPAAAPAVDPDDF